MRAIMLIELWERLLGYEKWTEAEATVRSSKLVDRLVSGRDAKGIWRILLSYPWGVWQSDCEIGWIDASGASRSGKYTVTEKSSLFQEYEGQRVSIRYNPLSPDEFYLRALFIDRLFDLFLRTIIILWLFMVAAAFAFSTFEHFQKLHR
jgi:hypothetical protein